MLKSIPNLRDRSQFSQKTSQLSPSPISILIVDDSEVDRATYMGFLRSSARLYQIMEAQTLETGLESWRSQCPDLVLLDFNLPDGNGREFLAAINGDNLESRLPVIVLTDQGDERTVVEAMKLGAADYLVKADVTEVSLTKSIRQVHDTMLLSRQLRRSQQHQAIVAEIALRVRQYLSLEEIFNEIVQTVQNFLATDRAIIYQFNPDRSGIIVAEAIIPPWQSCLNAQIIDSCFQENLLSAYQEGRIFAASDIYAANLTDCHRQLLERFEVRANLAVPILKPTKDAKNLWGLLIVHQCSGPRYWEESDLDLLTQLSVQLAIAFHQAELYQNLHDLNASLEQKVEERTRELKRSQATLQMQAQILNQVHAAVVATTIDGIIESWNRGAEELYGYSADEAIGQNINMLYKDPKYRETQVVIPLLAQGFHQVEVTTYSKLGKLLQTNLRLSVVQDEQGNIIRLICCSTDISDRQQAENKLYQINQQLEAKVAERTQELWQINNLQRAIFDSTDYSIISTDNNGIIQTFNVAAERMLGYSAAEVIGKATPSLIHGRQEIIDRAAVLSVKLGREITPGFEVFVVEARQGIVSEQEWNYIRKDGSSFPVLLSVTALKDINQEVIGFLGIAKDISERKRDEAKLKQLSDRLALSLKSGAIGCWEWDIGQNIILWDERMYELYGVTKPSCDQGDREPFFDQVQEGLLNQSKPSSAPYLVYDVWANGVHPDDRTPTEKLLQQAVLGEAEYDTEFRVVHPDGSVHFIKAFGVLVLDAQGNAQGITGVNFDITERKETEAKLAESEAKYRRLVEGVNNVIWSCNHQGIINYLSPQFKTIFGWSESEWIGKMFMNLVHPDDRSSIANDYRENIKDGKYSNNIEFRHLHQNGDYVWVRTSTTPVKNDEGEIVSIQGILSDISDIKQIEIALKSSENRFRKVFTSNVVGMMFTDFSGQVIDANDCFLEILGYRRADLIANRINWEKMTPPEYVDKDRQIMEHLEEYRAIAPWEKEYYRQDGSRVPVLIGVALLTDTDSSCVCVVVDISDRKQAEEKLQQQAQEERILAAIIQRMRSSLHLDEILNVTVKEIHHVLQSDRVLVYRIFADGTGSVIAESVLPNWPKILNIVFPEEIFPAVNYDRYLEGRVYALNDREDQNQPILPCLVEFLAEIQVKAKLVVPIIQNNSLWGLLISHQCDRPRQWQAWEIDLLKQIADQLAIAIQQSYLYQQLQIELLERQNAEKVIRQQAEREALLREITQRIRQSLDLETIFETAVQEVRHFLTVDRVTIFKFHSKLNLKYGEFVAESVLPEFTSLILSKIDRYGFIANSFSLYQQGKIEVLDNINNAELADCYLEFFSQFQVQASLIVPLLKSQGLWGLLCVHQCSNPRHWQNMEIEFLKQIANQLAIAIQQASLFEQLQAELTERQQTEIKLTQSNEQLAISNQELARATRLKDEFLANMSHELRTPLNAILGMTEGLHEGVFGSVNEAQIKALQTVEKSGSHLLSLINDILDVAKIESGQIELECTSVSINYLCQSSMAFIKQQALQKRIQLDIKLQLNLPNLLVDERRIRQVLINLLNNAMKFTSEGGRITLEVTKIQSNLTDSPQQNLIRIAVIDTGIGISSENINKLFKPFIQIDSALNRQYTGTGLGLALVKRIVELHGGRVDLTSEVGVGSCFTIELPCMPSKLDSSEGTSDHQLPATSEPDTLSDNQIRTDMPLILLAEDNEANISTISSYLGAKGYRILLAKDGKQAIDFATTHQPNLILMDIQMPGMDGLEAMKQIRSNPNLIDIPMIALTALAMTGDRERCLAAGANDYLTKPVKLKQLASLIQQLLE